MNCILRAQILLGNRRVQIGKSGVVGLGVETVIIIVKVLEKQNHSRERRYLFDFALPVYSLYVMLYIIIQCLMNYTLSFILSNDAN